MSSVGICFSGEPRVQDPLSHVGKKRPTYDRLLDLCIQKGWRTFVLTKKTYQGNSVFNGAWEYKDKKLSWTDEVLTADIVYDRTGGIKFPLEADNLKVVNVREFKIFCWDKWAAYQRLKEYMSQTFWLEDLKELDSVIPQVKTDWIVVKPFNGLQGRSIYIGPKSGCKDFEYDPKYKKYVVQEFVDTSNGVEGVVGGMHDIRVAIVNGKPVWGHVGEFFQR
jgi:glutathione synthase/RimK-type ligase-like ATP-grasp enzyme